MLYFSVYKGNNDNNKTMKYSKDQIHEGCPSVSTSQIDFAISLIGKTVTVADKDSAIGKSIIQYSESFTIEGIEVKDTRNRGLVSFFNTDTQTTKRHGNAISMLRILMGIKNNELEVA